MRRIKLKYKKDNRGYVIFIPNGRSFIFQSERKARDYCTWLSKGINDLLVQMVEEYKHLTDIKLDLTFMLTSYQDAEISQCFDGVMKQINWVLNHEFDDQGILFSCIEKIPVALMECSARIQSVIKNKSITFLNDRLRIRDNNLIEIRNKIGTMELEITRKVVLLSKDEAKVVKLKIVG